MAEPGASSHLPVARLARLMRSERRDAAACHQKVIGLTQVALVALSIVTRLYHRRLGSAALVAPGPREEDGVQTLDHDAVSVYMKATPDAVYDLVADVTRMADFSPEIRRCTWLDGARGPAVGARFEAVNKVQSGRAWTNKPVVKVVDPARRFSFARTERFAGTVEWTYRFEPEGDGTRVTESYEVTRPITRVGWFVIAVLYGRKDRRADLHAGMEETLERIRAVAERA